MFFFWICVRQIRQNFLPSFSYIATGVKKLLEWEWKESKYHIVEVAVEFLPLCLPAKFYANWEKIFISFFFYSRCHVAASLLLLGYNWIIISSFLREIVRKWNTENTFPPPFLFLVCALVLEMLILKLFIVYLRAISFYSTAV